MGELGWQLAVHGFTVRSSWPSYVPLAGLASGRDSPLGLERHLCISSTSLFRFHIQVTITENVRQRLGHDNQGIVRSAAPFSHGDYEARSVFTETELARPILSGKQEGR